MKTEFKGTKGPWSCNSVNTVHTIGDTYIPIANVGGNTKMERYHNSNLIAAAPDLLEALQNLLERYTELVNCGDCGNWNPETEDEVIYARIAIKKALNLA